MDALLRTILSLNTTTYNSGRCSLDRVVLFGGANWEQDVRFGG